MGGEGHMPPPTTEQQKHLDDLAERCSIFINYYGKVSPYQKKPSTLTNLAMTYEGRGLTIEFNAASGYPHSSGTCEVTVRNKKLVVLKAAGIFEGRQGKTVYRITATAYVPGNWEKKIRVLPRMR